MLKELNCPNCGASGLESRADGRVVCQYCGAQHAAAGTLCPACSHVNAEGAAFCSACGERLTRICPACQHGNWSGAEYCANCGQALDILEIVTQRTQEGMRERLEQKQARLPSLKEEEERASQERLAKMWETERARQAKLAEAAARQAARDRATLQSAALGVVVVICVVALVAIFLTLNR